MNMRIPSGSYQIPISKASVKNINDSVQWKNTEPELKLPEGYHPPDIALSPSSSDPNDGYFYDVYYDLNGYLRKIAQNAKANGSNETSSGDPANAYDSYMGEIKTYQKILTECDDDVAFCENLVKNNTDPLQKDCFQELLDRANTRRKNIGEQIPDQLGFRARMITLMNESNARFKRIKSVQDGKEDDPQTTAEIEEYRKGARIFEKIGRLDFRRLLGNPEDAATTFEYLYKTITENFGSYLRD